MPLSLANLLRTPVLVWTRVDRRLQYTDPHRNGLPFYQMFMPYSHRQQFNISEQPPVMHHISAHGDKASYPALSKPNCNSYPSMCRRGIRIVVKDFSGSQQTRLGAETRRIMRVILSLAGYVLILRLKEEL